MAIDTTKLGVIVAKTMEIIEEEHHQVSDAENVEVETVGIIAELVDEDGDKTLVLNFTESDLDKKLGLLSRVKYVMLS